jgi:hypothetical protein
MAQWLNCWPCSTSLGHSELQLLRSRLRRLLRSSLISFLISHRVQDACDFRFFSDSKEA